MSEPATETQPPPQPKPEPTNISDAMVASFLLTANPEIQGALIRCLARDAFVGAFVGFVFGVIATLAMLLIVALLIPWVLS